MHTLTHKHKCTHTHTHAAYRSVERMPRGVERMPGLVLTPRCGSTNHYYGYVSTLPLFVARLILPVLSPITGRDDKWGR